jgi:ribonuclease BN (tRNA processing enzyme)
MERAEASSMLVVNGVPYLIDVGVGSLHNLVAVGFHAEDIRAVFITHHHLDHDGGLADLVSYSSFGHRRTPMAIVGPAGTETMVAASRDYLAISRRIFGSEGGIAPDPAEIYRGKDITGDGVIYQDDHIRVVAVANSHYQTFKPDAASYGVDRSYSYRVETPDRVVVFTGDTGPSAPLVDLAKGADVLVSEVIDVPSAVTYALRTLPRGSQSIVDTVTAHMEHEHLNPEEVGKLASAAGVKMVVLSHLSPGDDDEHDATKYTAGVRRYYLGPVIAGRDLLEF